MTEAQKQTPPDRRSAATLSLPFDPLELTHVRCRPADLARMLETSRQAVSQWVKAGKITLGADGLLDPKVAVRQLLANSDPGRLRAKVLRPLTRDADSLRRQIAALQSELAKTREDRDFHEQAAREFMELIAIFRGLVATNIAELATAVDIDGALLKLWDASFQRMQDFADALAGPSAEELAAQEAVLGVFDLDQAAAVSDMGADIIDGIMPPAEGELEALLRAMDEEYSDIPRAPGDAVEGKG